MRWLSRSVLALCMGLFFGTVVLAAVPTRLEYQGYLTDVLGTPIDCQGCLTPYAFKFSLYEDVVGGEVLWTETHSGIDVANGVFRVELGSEQPLDADLLDGSRWLEIQINDLAPLAPRQRVVSVPYAMRADLAERAVESENAVTLGGQPAENFVQVDDTIDFITEAGLGDILESLGYVAGDNHTLAGMVCALDEILKWDGSTWVCSSIPNTDTLTGLNCVVGEVPKWNGTVWSCANDANTDLLSNLLCAAGEIVQWNGLNWVCSAALDVLVASLDPIAINGLPADLADGDNDALAVLSGACGPGQVPQWNGETWTCALVDAASTDNLMNTVDTMADLRAFPTLVDGKCVYMKGYHSIGDGGGGTFCWDLTPKADYMAGDSMIYDFNGNGVVDLTLDDDGGMTIIPDGYSGAGRWLRQHGGVINVLWFGANPRNEGAPCPKNPEVEGSSAGACEGCWTECVETGDTRAFKAAIKWAQFGREGGVNARASIFMPAGRYDISETLVLANVNSLRIFGAGRETTNLAWHGLHQYGTPMFLLSDTRSCHFENFTVSGGTSTPLHAAFISENGPETIVAPTRNTFKHLRLFAANKPGLDYGIRWTPISPGALDSNNDINTIFDVQVSNVTKVGFSIEHGQSKTHNFFRCSCSKGLACVKTGPPVEFELGQEVPFPIKTEDGQWSGSTSNPIRGGSFRWVGGNGGDSSVADFWLNGGGDNIRISGGDFENSRRLIYKRGADIPVVVEGVRWSGNKVADWVANDPNGDGFIDGDSIHSGSGAICHHNSECPSLLSCVGALGCTGGVCEDPGQCEYVEGVSDWSIINLKGGGPFHFRNNTLGGSADNGPQKISWTNFNGQGSFAFEYNTFYSSSENPIEGKVPTRLEGNQHWKTIYNAVPLGVPIGLMENKFGAAHAAFGSSGKSDTYFYLPQGEVLSQIIKGRLGSQITILGKEAEGESDAILVHNDCLRLANGLDFHLGPNDSITLLFEKIDPACTDTDGGYAWWPAGVWREVYRSEGAGF